MADLTLGGPDGGNAVVASVIGGAFTGSASWDFPDDYDPAGHVAFLPFLAEWTADRPPLVFLAPADAESAKSVPYPAGVVRVQLLDDKGENVGQLNGVRVGFVQAPEAGGSVTVSYRLDRES